jgi:hypothetical protein
MTNKTNITNHISTLVQLNTQDNVIFIFYHLHHVWNLIEIIGVHEEPDKDRPYLFDRKWRDISTT